MGLSETWDESIDQSPQCKAYRDDIARLRAVLEIVRTERDRYREALVKINDMGAVCSDFMECDHRSCRDSCGAKLTALAALEGEVDA